MAPLPPLKWTHAHSHRFCLQPHLPYFPCWHCGGRVKERRRGAQDCGPTPPARCSASICSACASFSKQALALDNVVLTHYQRRGHRRQRASTLKRQDRWAPLSCSSSQTGMAAADSKRAAAAAAVPHLPPHYHRILRVHWVLGSFLDSATSHTFCTYQPTSTLPPTPALFPVLSSLLQTYWLAHPFARLPAPASCASFSHCHGPTSYFFASIYLPKQHTYHAALLRRAYLSPMYDLSINMRMAFP